MAHVRRARTNNNYTAFRDCSASQVSVIFIINEEICCTTESS